MKARVTEDCIACGLCVDICPDVFEMGVQLAQVKTDNIPKQLEEAVRQAADDCPVSAIIIET
jgi:ferredoxin